MHTHMHTRALDATHVNIHTVHAYLEHGVLVGLVEVRIPVQAAHKHLIDS